MVLGLSVRSLAENMHTTSLLILISCYFLPCRKVSHILSKFHSKLGLHTQMMEMRISIMRNCIRLLDLDHLVSETVGATQCHQKLRSFSEVTRSFTGLLI
jgi:hypothetical protein